MAPSAAPAPSLRRQLVAGLAIAVSLFWLLATSVAGLVIRHEINEVSDSALQEVAQRVLPLAYAEILGREEDDAGEHRLPGVGRHGEYITYVVREASGKVLLQSHDADASLFPQDLPAGFVDRNDTRYYTESVVRGSVIVSAMEKPGHRTGALRKALLALALPLALLLPAIMAATVWLVTRSVRPVAALGAAITARGEGNLTPVAHDGLPAEVRPVGMAVNALLDRLRRALEAERSFTANSAHELRTPVAGALAQTQRLLAELGDVRAHARARDIEAALLRLSRLTEKLLQLAKAEGGLLRAAAPQDMRPIVSLVLADLPGAERVETRLPDRPVLSLLDIDVFAIALRNLVENALKYSPANTLVQVELTADAVLRVSNQGTPLTGEAFARLRQRFERGGSTEEGAGLGLAIVDAIARGTGSAFTLEPGASDGVAFRLTLPRS